MQGIGSRALRRLLSGANPVLLLVVLGVLSAPGAAVAEKVKVKAVIAAAEDINPNYQGRASPVRLVLFQLASADVFNEADFFALYDEQSGVLGGDLLKRSAQMVQPGETIEFEEEFDDATGFLGVIAAFRDIDNAAWRSVVELEAKGFFSLRRSNKLTIELSGLSVAVTVD